MMGALAKLSAAPVLRAAATYTTVVRSCPTCC
jgi:ABC-type arginine transport system permease subunit